MEKREVLICQECTSNQLVQIILDEDRITHKKYLDNSVKSNLYLGLGLVDLQINGFAGIDFNQFPITSEGLLQVIEALMKKGVTSFLPTIITNSDERIIDLLRNIDQLLKQNPYISSFIPGIHLEGPFISPEAGARGAHDFQFIKAPDWSLFQEFQEASGHRIKIVTLSPEWKEAPAFIKKCVQQDILVAIGHTIASPEQIQEAVDAGVRLSTHLGNGAPLMLPRNNNFIFEQLAQPKLCATLIADGFHLPNSFLKIALQVKSDNAVLVSDSTQFAGMKPGIYKTHIGGKVLLQDNHRLCTFENDKILAGSAVSLLDCVQHLYQSEIRSLQQAWNLASERPGNILDFPTRSQNGSLDQDFVIFEIIGKTIVVQQVFKSDQRIYNNYITN